MRAHLLLAALCAWAPAQAQGLGVQDVFEALYAKLAQSFSPPTDPGGGAGAFILLQPALTLDPDPGQAREDLSLLADQIPRIGPLYLPSGFRASEVYAAILDQEPSNFVPQSDREAALEARKAILDHRRPGKYTQAYQAYLDLEDQKQAADDALATAKANQAATRQPVPPGIQAAVDRLDKALRLPRADFRRKRALMEAADSDHMGARLERDHRSLELAAAGGTPPVEASPDPADWAGAPGWIRWTFSGQETPLPRPASAPAGPVGIPRAPGAAPALDALTIAMEACRVRLDRPWMDVALFTNRFWRMTPGARWPLISAGGLDARDPGPMPLRIDGLLLARNLRITGVGAQVATGLAQDGHLPFAPKGASSTSPPGPPSLSFSVDGIQIIGLFCSRIPRCPDPDPAAFRTPEPTS